MSNKFFEMDIEDKKIRSSQFSYIKNAKILNALIRNLRKNVKNGKTKEDVMKKKSCTDVLKHAAYVI